ncbi:hypothetical protein UNSWDHB_473 [Dehalobacter sp. UNSWDHB]|nr:hypothetical protein UNSWDHB_473 [Dehalobacter sp. UNSWDHB]
MLKTSVLISANPNVGLNTAPSIAATSDLISPKLKVEPTKVV